MYVLSLADNVSSIEQHSMSNLSHPIDHPNAVYLDIFEAMKLNLYRYSPAVSIILIVAYSIVFIIGLTGNSIIFMVTSCRTHRLCTTSDLFFINLALADTLVLLVCLPATLLSNLITRKYVIMCYNASE